METFCGWIDCYASYAGNYMPPGWANVLAVGIDQPLPSSVTLCPEHARALRAQLKNPPQKLIDVASRRRMSFRASVDRPRAARPASSANGYRRKRGIWRNEGDRSPLPAALVCHTRSGGGLGALTLRRSCRITSIWSMISRECVRLSSICCSSSRICSIE